jgi:geranylgeranylglycerol-phosphate geranylgeranyltransferase
MDPYISVMRPVNGIMSAVAVYIGSVIAGSPVRPPLEIMLGMLIVFLICSGGMIVNDIKDVVSDKVNKPKRPLASGKISKFTAGTYAVILFLAGNGIAFYFLPGVPFAVALLATAILILYAAFMKRVIMAGHLLISALVALTFIYGGVITGNADKVYILASLAFLSNIGREVYKTIDDALGDKKQNVSTLATKLGVFRTKMVASFFIILAVIISFVPYFSGTFDEVYLFFVVIADAIFLAAVAAPSRYSSKLTKIAMVVALVAFLAGAYTLRAQ